ncbi:AraC family transcriptional regulator [Neobacillus drentensis]|uniref:AraC family transcriptional regulator n=1 Tax=Neobacillus drentensis TaxID=220684 RepID=UPI00285C23AD|nr:AraC family transcriptional regulator [Neobacillus drentensis]MDR7238871.1 AraC-like DNA-binding protein [Neobacillus drentensis]
MDKPINFPYKSKIMDEWINAFYRVKGMENYISEFHSHQEYEIYFFHSGDCKYLINNRIYELQPGDIILLDGMTLHKPNPGTSSPYTRSMLHFSPTWLQELLNALGIPNLLDPFKKLNNCLLRTGYDENGQFVDGRIKEIAASLEHIVEEAQQTGKKNEFLEAEVKLELVQLLLGIYKMSQKQLSQITSKKSEKELHAEEIASWINDHYKRKVSLDKIASELNLSKYYASHVFKEVTGFTVMEYVMACRLNQVKYLLEMEPNQSLTEVSQSSGFESVAHFSRFFKEKVGITPSQYRKTKLSRNIPVNKEVKHK